MKKPTARNLSDREMQVLKLAAEGMTNKEIGRALDLSDATVKVHVKAVLRKLQADNRTHGVVIALRAGIVPLHPDPEPTGEQVEEAVVRFIVED